MTTNDDQYVPSEDEMRHAYWLTRMLDHHAAVDAAFDRFLARVRRDAAREALDGLINECRTEHEEAATNNRVGGMALELHAQQVAMNYRDTHYPEETP